MSLTYQSASEILDLLKLHPRGITAKAAAMKLNCKPARASQRLGLMAMYGNISRTLDGREYVYRLKPPAPAKADAPMQMERA